MKKTTQLMEELNGSDDINSFLSNNKDSLDRQDFARYLCELVKKKKMTKIEVIRISQLNGINIKLHCKCDSDYLILAWKSCSCKYLISIYLI